MSEMENKNEEVTTPVEKVENTAVAENSVQETKEESWKKECCKTTKNPNLPYIIIIVMLVLIAILSFFAWKNFDTISSKVALSNLEIQIISDKNCAEDTCHTTELTQNIEALPFLTGAKFTSKDYADSWVKDLLKANWIQYLPAVLLNTNNLWTSTEAKNFSTYLTWTTAWLFSLNVWIEYDPSSEVCSNGKDDNADWLTDCDDPKCWKELACQKKVDKPVADLYIMSYCPYWLQAQKWYLEVMSKLGKVADVNIKWVQYTMHGDKERQENVVQECIKEEQSDKYVKYLNCFLAEEWKWEACRKEAKIDETKLSSCIDSTKKKYDIDAETTDKYPAFNINKEEALKAWVEWSPTFVLNWVKVENIWRSAKDFADAICSTFKDKPKECSEDFQDITFDPSFGFTTWNGANQANSACGAQ